MLKFCEHFALTQQNIQSLEMDCLFFYFINLKRNYYQGRDLECVYAVLV